MAVEIFFCYAHEDEELRKGLEKQLRALKRQGIIDIWHDRAISAGVEWEREIDRHLNSANIILLLVSPDFMDSDYCYSQEMLRAMERQERGDVQVIPVILRPVYWQGAPFGKLQALPTDAKAIISWPRLDEAFFDVAEGIREVVSNFRKKPISNDEENARPEIVNKEYIEKLSESAIKNLNTHGPRLGGATINMAKREINIKIVYYGIASSGKTTNLHYIHQAVNPRDVGDMMSIETETERTLYFDLLPLELGEVHGFQLRCQLYTVPRSILYNHMRVSSALKGASGVIFVADSSPGKLKENIDCWNELLEQLRHMNVDVSEFPLIVQWNNRDLKDALPVPVLEQYLNPYHFPSFEAVAVTGQGVMECLRAAVNAILRNLERI